MRRVWVVNMIYVYTLCENSSMADMGDRLKEARLRTGKSARQAAMQHNWPPSTYAAHENGQNDFGLEDAKKYAKAFKTTAAWLLTGETGNIPHQRRNKFQQSEQSGTQPELDEMVNSVPEIDLRAGASYAGGFNQEENTIDEQGNSVSRDAIRTNWGIPKPFLRDELHIRTGRAHILSVRGDSMNDALYDGDRAIINLDDTDVSQGGIFALLDDNSSVIIKQVELVRQSGSNTRRIRCTSRNPVYSPFELELDEERVKIIGRVASKITRL